MRNAMEEQVLEAERQECVPPDVWRVRCLDGGWRVGSRPGFSYREPMESPGSWFSPSTVGWSAS